MRIVPKFPAALISTADGIQKRLVDLSAGRPVGELVEELLDEAPVSGRGEHRSDLALLQTDLRALVSQIAETFPEGAAPMSSRELLNLVLLEVAARTQRALEAAIDAAHVDRQTVLGLRDHYQGAFEITRIDFDPKLVPAVPAYGKFHNPFAGGGGFDNPYRFGDRSTLNANSLIRMSNDLRIIAFMDRRPFVHGYDPAFGMLRVFPFMARDYDPKVVGTAHAPFSLAQGDQLTQARFIEDLMRIARALGRDAVWATIEEGKLKTLVAVSRYDGSGVDYDPYLPLPNETREEFEAGIRRYLAESSKAAVLASYGGEKFVVTTLSGDGSKESHYKVARGESDREALGEALRLLAGQAKDGLARLSFGGETYVITNRHPTLDAGVHYLPVPFQYASDERWNQARTIADETGEPFFFTLGTEQDRSLWIVPSEGRPLDENAFCKTLDYHPFALIGRDPASAVLKTRGSGSGSEEDPYVASDDETREAFDQRMISLAHYLKRPVNGSIDGERVRVAPCPGSGTPIDPYVVAPAGGIGVLPDLAPGEIRVVLIGTEIRVQPFGINDGKMQTPLEAPKGVDPITYARVFGIAHDRTEVWTRRSTRARLEKVEPFDGDGSKLRPIVAIEGQTWEQFDAMLNKMRGASPVIYGRFEGREVGRTELPRDRDGIFILGDDTSTHDIGEKLYVAAQAIGEPAIGRRGTMHFAMGNVDMPAETWAAMATESRPIFVGLGNQFEPFRRFGGPKGDLFFGIDDIKSEKRQVVFVKVGDRLVLIPPLEQTDFKLRTATADLEASHVYVKPRTPRILDAGVGGQGSKEVPFKFLAPVQEARMLKLKETAKLIANELHATMFVEDGAGLIEIHPDGA